MSIKEYRFEPEYLPYSNRRFLDKDIHDFQESMQDLFSSKSDCLFISAPTGTGKTFAFGLPTFSEPNVFQRRKTLIIAPTNLLINEMYENLSELKRQNAEIEDVNIKKLTGKDLIQRSLIKREEEIQQSFINNDILISNPDIISLLVSGFYYSNARKGQNFRINRLKNPQDIFSKLDVIIFDEYHRYSEEEIGKILSFIVMSRLTGNRMKAIFTSATPEEKVMHILEGMGLTCKALRVNTTAEKTEHSRKVRGSVVIRFSDKYMLNELESSDLSAAIRRLYLFDHKVDAERAVNFLIGAGIAQSEIQELTGFMQRSTTKKEYTNKERFVIATNAAEQGLNLNVDVAHIEPGLYLENLSQRYGRIAREGASGDITIYVDGDVLKNLPEKVDSFKELEESLRSIFRTKETYASRIKTHYAAFMSLCAIRSVRERLKEQIVELFQMSSDKMMQSIFWNILNFDHMVGDITTSSKLSRVDSQALREWWEEFLSAIGYFRGQSSSVVVNIARSVGSITTTEDLKWVKKWCQYEHPVEKNGEFLVKSFYSVPMPLNLKYDVPLGSFFVNETEFRSREKFRSKLIEGFNEFIDDALEDEIPDTNAFRLAFEKVSGIVYPEMLVPKEILDVSETQIL